MLELIDKEYERTNTIIIIHLFIIIFLFEIKTRVDLNYISRVWYLFLYFVYICFEQTNTKIKLNKRCREVAVSVDSMTYTKKIKVFT